MIQPLNQTEGFVQKLCQQFFLSLWSYANPQGKDARKELCDLLVVCDPDIIIFSVKEIEVQNIGRHSTDWSRWQKRAIEVSVVADLSPMVLMSL
jgi:hypothetical protein